jgi:predicted secreted protein
VRLIVLAGAFVILWFLALQILLPIGIRSSREVGEEAEGGVDPGAPDNPRLGMKLALATAGAAVIWTIFYALMLMRAIDI